VTWRKPVPSGFIVQMCGTVSNVWWTNAIRLPSGDQTGAHEIVSLGFRRTRRRPVPFGRTV
jgi:hypothetical protein